MSEARALIREARRPYRNLAKLIAAFPGAVVESVARDCPRPVGVPSRYLCESCGARADALCPAALAENSPLNGSPQKRGEARLGIKTVRDERKKQRRAALQAEDGLFG